MATVANTIWPKVPFKVQLAKVPYHLTCPSPGITALWYVPARRHNKLDQWLAESGFPQGMPTISPATDTKWGHRRGRGSRRGHIINCTLFISFLLYFTGAISLSRHDNWLQGPQRMERDAAGIGKRRSIDFLFL